MATISESDNQKKECVELLLNIGCCSRCALRFIGEEVESRYRMSAKELRKYFDIEASKETADDSEKVCISCLGILSAKFCGESFCTRIADQIKKDNFEFVDYYVALSTPVTMLIRDHSIWIYLQEKFKDFYNEESREKILTIKEVWRFYNVELLTKLLGKPFNTTSSLTINVNFENKKTAVECNFLLDLFPYVFKRRKHIKNGCETFNRTNVSKALKDLKFEKFKRNYCCPPKIPSEMCSCSSIIGSHDALFVAGRYNKYSRILSQTEWIVDGARKTESSIEEYIAKPLKTHIQPDSLRFSSSGREDVDVKMLGNGRPFVFEVINPRRVILSQQDLNQIQKEINDSTKDISVRDLQLVTKEETNMLKDGEMDKMKCYSAICWCSRKVTQEELDKLEQLSDLVLQQKTPIRVLHRRPLAVREKTVHKMKAKLLNDNHFILKLDTQAGTYIKEFVHGDFGRTTPNLCSILQSDCDILQLDVQAVLLDWPKPIEISKT